MFNQAYRLWKIEDALYTHCFLRIASAGAGHSKALAVQDRTWACAYLLVVLGVDKPATENQLIVELFHLVEAPSPASDFFLSRRLVWPILLSIGP